MSHQITIDKNVYAIPVGDMWNVNVDRLYILYSPLNGRISLASPDTVNALRACVSGENQDKVMQDALSVFQAKGSVPVHYLPDTPHDLYQIDILANYTCNFKCIYCYSAEGRSKKQIEFEKIKAVIDYLFCSGKEQKNPYIINFSGGGEPLLSFDLIKQTVNYIEQVNKDKNYVYNIGLVTNGSLITSEIIDFLQEHKVDMAVSFEILERLQNKERGAYDRVSANIDMMLERDFPFGIRTTFTPESVTCMCEMIDELATRFPKLKKVVYDTVLAPSLFASPEELRKYYNTFLDEYWKAKQKGAEMGIAVESIAVEMLSMVRDRTCEGKIVLTPMGTISSCARVSSPLEERYEDYIYGEVKENELYFDQHKFTNIISQNNIYTQSMCEECFARWNCGGGCRLFHHSFNQEYEAVRCDFVRNALKRQLIKVLSDNYHKSLGANLQEFISDKLNKNEI
ncbi:MAG: radical SAM protein [Bacteroidales bacterium]|nr:radical SAM protein [Bacteroidales bacterium]